MRNVSKLMSFVLLIFVTLPINAQTEVGKLFSVEEANQLFGPVTKEKTVQISEFRNYLDKTQSYLFIKLDMWNYSIAGDDLRAIYPLNQKTGDTYYKFSKSKIEQLLNVDTVMKEIRIQQRSNVLSLQVGETVLELSLPCPPYCE